MERAIFKAGVEKGRRVAIVAIADTETTGTDPQLDEIIDIAVIIVEADELGQIVRIDRIGQALRDPGMPIPAVISRLTGITDDDVRGQTIDLVAKVLQHVVRDLAAHPVGSVGLQQPLTQWGA